MARRLLAGLAALLVLTAASCTYDHHEPGLFRTRAPAPPSTPPTVPPHRSRPEPTNPALPVAGDAVWTTGDGNHVTVRIAVHAVRRSPGATVLDWSVTPLAAPGLHRGDDLPGTTNLGLARGSASTVSIVLVEPGTHRVVRPLTHASRSLFNHCLCTPVWLVQQSMRVGETELMQVAYPPLRTRTRYVDVAFTTVAPISHVPVTPEGQVPTAKRATNLARPPMRRRPVAPEVSFRSAGPPARRLSLQIDRVVQTTALTSLEWTLRSRDSQGQSSLDPYGLPVTAPVPDGITVANTKPASGPDLKPTGGSVAYAASWMTTTLNGAPAYECLCTELAVGSRSLLAQGGSAHLVTSYRSLPATTRRVDVQLAGVGAVRGVAVEPAVDAALELGPPAVHRVGRWSYPDEAPPPAWRTSDWPLPVPDAAQLKNYESRRDGLTAVPTA